MKNKKSIILTIVAVVTLLALVVGATFAYFAAGGGASTSANVKVETSNQDILTFVVGDQINIEATQTTFSSGKGNASGNTTAKAILKTANEENELKANYYLYLNISKNEFSYTTKDNTAELLLKITDPSGNQVTSLDGLTYKTLTDGSNTSQSGFDITTKSGLITIANNKEIKAKPETTEEWKVEIVFVNLDEDQSGNAGKGLTAKLLIQKEEKEITLADVCSNGSNLASCIKTYANNGSSATNIYIHNSSLTNGTGDNSYRYAGGAHPAYYSCTYNGNNVYNYENYEYNKSLQGDCSVVYKATYVTGIEYLDKTFEDYYYNEPVSAVWDQTNSVCKTSSGSEEVYDWYNNKITSESGCTGVAYQYEDENVYYVGIENLGAGVETLYSDKSNGVNNYVCFGSNETPCPYDNLYRIIGVFEDNVHGVENESLVKLVKYDYATSSQLGTTGAYYKAYSYSWGSSSTYKGSNYSNIAAYYWNNETNNNTWSESNLNKANLNGTYLSSFGDSWSNMIAETSWKVGGNTYANIVTSAMNTAYQNEIVTPAETTTYSAKIGLMYVSDYGYAASPTYWTYPGSSSSGDSSYDYHAAVNENWMYMGLYECTISRDPDDSFHAFLVYDVGNVSDFPVSGDGYGIRPVFYLKSSTSYASGSGTASEPIRLS